LTQAQRYVAGTRWHIDNQIVESLPCDFAEKLLYGAVQHRPTPDDGRIFRREKTHRHNLQAMLLGWHDLLSISSELCSRQPEHDRHIGTVDVAVENANAASAARERQSQIDRNGRLTDAALPRADGDDVLDPGQRRSSRFWR